jgi:hypothetical protein
MNCARCLDTGFSLTPTEFFCEVCKGNPVKRQVRALRLGVAKYTDPENILTTAEMANLFDEIVKSLLTIEENV